MLSNLTIRNPGASQILVVALVLLTTLFWTNAFRFYPTQIDRSYDDTSEGLVIGRLARAAADGLTSENADLGQNFDPRYPRPADVEVYGLQKGYFENPQLVDSLHLNWAAYPSQFGLQGIFFSAIDAINPLPRTWRIGFYHLLAALMSAGAMIWIADILRRRFGWPAFYGFLVPLALEPMLTALAPNLYWVVGIWFAPIAIAMLLADEENSRRRFRLVAAAFVCFLVKCLCGYEFISTVIVAAAVGCLLGVKEGPDRLSRALVNMAWIVTAGIAGFVVAVFAHAAKQGSFAAIAERAAARVTGDSPSLQMEIILGKFVSIHAVILRYLEGNNITLIKNFGIPLGLLVLAAALALMDEKITWYLGRNRRNLQILALAFLASLAAPLSWFILAKAHSFDHPALNFILWYVPTIPLGCALVGVSLNQAIENRSLWSLDAARRAVTIAIPTVIILIIGTIYFSDRLMRTERAWVVSVHAKGIPVFESEDLGVEFRMTDQWFTLQYDCDAAAPIESFFIRAFEGDKAADYSFNLKPKLIYARRYKCFYAQGKADRPYSRVEFGAMSKASPIWRREAPISIPESFTPDSLTDADWDHGISRSAAELLLAANSFGQLFLKKGDLIQLSPSDQRTVTKILTQGSYKIVSIDGGAVKSSDVVTPIRIIRQ